MGFRSGPGIQNVLYKTLLPELKAKGKAVIVITHDDRYFKGADKLIKMDMGKIVSRVETAKIEASVI